MSKPYRNACALPSLALLILAIGCSAETPPPEETTKPHSNAYLEALQEAEAAKQGADQRGREQQRIDQLLGRGQD